MDLEAILEDLESIWEAKLGQKSIKNHVEIWLKIWLEKKSENEARWAAEFRKRAGPAEADPLNW